MYAKFCSEQLETRKKVDKVEHAPFNDFNLFLGIMHFLQNIIYGYLLYS